MKVRDLIDRLEEYPDYYEVEIKVVSEYGDPDFDEGAEFAEYGVGFAIVKRPVVQVDARTGFDGVAVVLS